MTSAGVLEGIRAGLRRFARSFDPALVTAEDAQRIVTIAAAIEKIAATIKAMAAARVAETELWRRGGAKSAAHQLARESGTGVGAAREALAAGKRLTQLPTLAEAAQDGELSPQQTQAIADAASVDPSAEQRLVEQAKRSSLGELRDECARTKAAAEDQEQRRRRILAERYCRRRTTPDGAGELYYRSTVDHLARIWAVIQGFADDAFRQARAEGRHENPDAYAADGLLAMAKAAVGAPAGATTTSPAADGTRQAASTDGPGAEHGAASSAGPQDTPTPTGKSPVPATLIFRIDWDAFVRGWPIDGELCEIAGVGPVPVSVVEEMLASGDPFLAAVVTKGKDVVNVAHLGRRHTAHQRTAMAWRDPMCTVEGCSATMRLEHDHRHDWARTKLTLLAWSDRLCSHHHDLKTHKGWALVEGAGKRPMVPPGHPDHPGNDPPDPPDPPDRPDPPDGPDPPDRPDPPRSNRRSASASPGAPRPGSASPGPGSGRRGPPKDERRRVPAVSTLF